MAMYSSRDAGKPIASADVHASRELIPSAILSIIQENYFLVVNDVDSDDITFASWNR
jgi:hypothetical protein